ncbi:MAG: signal peptide peptidase SppA [Pseudomonadota bacterium]
MAVDIDAVLDRRQLRSKLSFWRITGIVALAVAIIGIMGGMGLFGNLGKTGDHIARVAINGMITEDRQLIKMLDQIAQDNSVKGVLLSVDSPGGTTVGGEAIFEAVRRVAEQKPVVSSVGTLAASAGYMIATGADHIVARRSSIVGSIGVIFQYPQATGLLDKIGVQVKSIKSSPLKAEPSPFNPTPPEAEEAIRTLIDDSYQWFVDLVTDRRPLERDEVLKLADGSVYSGDRGLKTKLVDALGGELVAKKWLVEEKNLDANLKVLDWKPVRPRQGLFGNTALAQWLLGDKATPLTVDPKALGDAVPGLVPKRLFLDGLLSIWQQ